MWIVKGRFRTGVRNVRGRFGMQGQVGEGFEGKWRVRCGHKRANRGLIAS